MNFSCKTVVVAGAGRIGEGIACCLAQFGANLNVADIDGDAVDCVASNIDWTAVHATAVRTDITSDAGVTPITEAAVRQLRSLNFASTAGLRPRLGLTWYNGSGRAAIALTKSMAVELAPDHIRVNAIHSVKGATGMLRNLLPGEDSEEVRSRSIASIPLGWSSQPRDIAHAATFLARPEADLIRDACPKVDGGRCI